MIAGLILFCNLESYVLNKSQSGSIDFAVRYAFSKILCIK